MYKKILARARELEDEMSKEYRHLHKIAEQGLDLPKTVAYCRERLLACGYTPVDCGGGLVATIGEGEGGILLRADMDALPIREESGLFFAADNGNMHACGHDMHTVMLLYAARLLREFKGELKVKAKLCFQPGEELLKGAERMINAGLLSDPEPQCAVMLHVLTATEHRTGTIVIPPEGIGASGADFFRVTVRGKGCHGSQPHLGRDPIHCASHMVIALSSLVARELPTGGGEVLSIGKINGGDAANAIADAVAFEGTLRSYDDERRKYIKERLYRICNGISDTFGCRGSVDVYSGCPSFINDKGLVGYAKEIFSDTEPQPVIVPEGSRGGGSEDFAFVSRLVPSIMLALCAGEKSEGYTAPLHSPNARFDEKALPYGAAALASMALGMDIHIPR